MGGTKEHTRAKQGGDAGSALEFLWQRKFVELQFTDLFGGLQHITIPSVEFTDESFRDGFGKLDGSSIRGFADISESDMVMRPIPGTQTIIPWVPETSRILVQIHKGADGGRFEKDTRGLAKNAETYQKGGGYRSYFGPEPEFFIFDTVRIDAETPGSGTGYKVESTEFFSGRQEGHGLRPKEGYYPVGPMDQTDHVRKAIVSTLLDHFGFEHIEAAHHEVARAQAEINFKYGQLVETADRLQTLKYVARNVGKQHNKVVTFMPKPVANDNGSGLHTHFSLWDQSGTRNLMYDKDAEVAELSQVGRYATGGLLGHGRALSAIVSPTVNSYHRLIPGFEAPVYLAWSPSNRSAVVRIPTYFKGVEHAKRLEYRAPDPSTNPYMAFSAILMAGIDGIKHKIDPGPPVVNENIYHMTAEKRKELGIRELPRSLHEALDELESDSAFLKPVFPESLLRTYVDEKRAEARRLASFPSAMEVHEYLDA
jgi:glutamine synthetase